MPMIPDHARQARQRLGHLLGRTVTQREMSEMLGLSDGWRHYEAGRRRMSTQLAKHVRLLLRVHEHIAEIDECRDMILWGEWTTVVLSNRLRDAAAKLAGDDR